MKAKSSLSTSRKRCIIYFIVIGCFVGYVVFLYRMVIWQHQKKLIETSTPTPITIIKSTQDTPSHNDFFKEPSKPIPPKPLQPIVKPDILQQHAIHDTAVAANESPSKPSNQPKPLRVISTASLEEIQSAVVIVGGTDGSGTRRIVQALTELGVKMVSEDPETYDIHADLVGGWPPIVTPVLRHTHGLNYRAADLALRFPGHQTQVRQLQRLLAQVEVDSHKPTSHVLAKGGVLPHPPDVVAQRVAYGFKAPVAMALLPYWHSLLPSVIFVHALRDGRDIAFSANQGPVDKFFAATYASQYASLSPPQKAVKLWSDWNCGVLRYAQSCAHGNTTAIAGATPAHPLAYQAVHAEDLVAENRQVRYAALSALAQLVGSSLSAEEVCCLSLKEVAFMGSHDRSVLKGADQGEAAQLSRRYGKWRRQVAQNAALNTSLHLLGSEGLQSFGYEPLRPLPSDTGSGYRCEMVYDQCLARFPARMANLEDSAHVAQVRSADWSAARECEVVPGVDFKGEDLDSLPISLDDPALRCRECKRRAGCRHFTVDPNSLVCYLKHGKSGATPSANLLSGSISSVL